MLPLRPLTVALAALPPALTAILVNYTIDDDSTQVIYAPPLQWHSSAVACSTCLQPNLSLVFDQSFHDGTGGLQDQLRAVFSDGKDDKGNDNDGDTDDVNPNLANGPSVTATISFTGVALYVYCIIPDGNDGDHVSLSNLTFTLDDRPDGSFVHQPPNASIVTFLYDTLVYSVENLPNVAHELAITAPPDSALLFDYAIYAAPAPEPSPGADSVPTAAPSQTADKQKNTISFAVAVGASVGTLSLITLALCISLRCRRAASARRRLAEEHAAPEPAFVPRFFSDVDTPPEERYEATPAAPFVPRFFSVERDVERDGTLTPNYSPPPSAALLGEEPPSYAATQHER